MTHVATIPKNDLATLLLNSFRYCLGRQSYDVSECVEQLIEHWDIMPETWRKSIHWDILSAIANHTAGMDMDEEQWRRILQLPIEESV